MNQTSGMHDVEAWKTLFTPGMTQRIKSKETFVEQFRKFL